VDHIFSTNTMQTVHLVFEPMPL